MRKADYTLLASIIREEVDAYREPENEAQEMRLSTATDIARAFASHASVDKAAFLKACGITE